MTCAAPRPACCCAVAQQLHIFASLPATQVGLLDIDICGPSVPKMLGLEGEEIHQSGAGWSPVYVQVRNRGAVWVCCAAVLLCNAAVVGQLPTDRTPAVHTLLLLARLCCQAAAPVLASFAAQLPAVSTSAQEQGKHRVVSIGFMLQRA